MNYGSRDEIIRGVRKLAQDVAEGKFESGRKLRRIRFLSYLDTAGVPDPDLLIRTSGEQRLSNYLYVAAGIYRVLFYRCSMAGFS